VNLTIISSVTLDDYNAGNQLQSGAHDTYAVITDVQFSSALIFTSIYQRVPGLQLADHKEESI